MTSSDESRLRHLTRLSLRGDHGAVRAFVRERLDELDEAELLIAARSALAEDDLELCAAASERLQRLAPDADDTLDIRLHLAVRRGDHDDALATVRRIQKWDLLVTQPVVREVAAQLIRRHDWRNLADLLERCQGGVDTLPPALLRARAVLNLRRRNYTDATADAVQALHAAPAEEKADSAVLVARCFERNGHVDEAAKTYRGSLWNHKPHPRHHYRAAQAAVRVRRFPMARRMLQKAANAGAGGPWLEWVRGYVQLHFKTADEALQIFQELCERDPENIAFAVAWLDAFEASQPPSEALARVDQLLSQFDDPRLYARRIELLQALGHADQARAELDDALEAFPEDPELRELRERDLAGTEVSGEHEDTSGGRSARRALEEGARGGTEGRNQENSETIVARVEESGHDQSAWPELFRPQWSAQDLRRRTGLWEALPVQLRVMNTLLLREIQTRYGRAKLGYLWAVIEPALHMAVFHTLWSFRGREAMDGMPLLLFLITGFIPYFTFSHTYGGCTGAVQSNTSLLSHATVTEFDLIFSKCILEGLTKITVFTLFIGGVYIGGMDVSLLDPHMILVGFFMLWVTGVGFGLVLESLSSIMVSLPRVVGRMTRFLYFTSGVMFPVTSLPYSLQELMAWNPLVHLITTIRYSFLRSDVPDWLTLTYPLGIAVALLFFGLVAFRAMQRRLKAA